VPAPLFATGAAIPQGASSLHEQTGGWIEVTGVAGEEGVVMGIHGGDVLAATSRVQPVGVGDEAKRR
jgi:hypothetical protein